MISTDNSVQRLRNQKLNKTKCDFLGQIRLVTSSPDSIVGKKRDPGILDPEPFLAQIRKVEARLGKLAKIRKVETD